MEAKRQALKNLIKHMHKAMAAGDGDEEMEDGDIASTSVKPDGDLPDELSEKEPELAADGEHGVYDDEGPEHELKEALKDAFTRRRKDTRKTMVVIKSQKIPSQAKQMKAIAKSVRKRSKM